MFHHETQEEALPTLLLDENSAILRHSLEEEIQFMEHTDLERFKIQDTRFKIQDSDL